MSKLTDEEQAKLVHVFEEMNVKPDMDDPEAMKRWMRQYVKGESRAQASPSSSSSEPQQVAHVIQNPRIIVFSGDQTKDAAYDIWKYEVRSLLREKIHALPVIVHAVRKSLRGEAARAVMRLGERADIDVILEKLDAIYEVVEPVEVLLSKFYSSEQGEQEAVASWACRLEDMLANIIRRGKVDVSMSMVKNKFWSGLRQPLRDASRHKFDQDMDFETFLVHLRAIEAEIPKSEPATKTGKAESSDKGKTQSKMAQEPKQEYVELKAAVEKLTDTVENLHKLGTFSKSQYVAQGYDPARDNPARGRGYRGRGTYRGYRGNTAYGRGQGRGQTYGYRGYGPSQNSHQDKDSKSTPGDDKTQGKSDGDKQTRDVCWRCGQSGHLRIGCRVNLN